MPADDNLHNVHKVHGARPARLRLLVQSLAPAGALVLLAACGGSGGGTATGPTTTTVTASAPTSASASAAASATTAISGAPDLVAVTKGGALEVLNPANGSVVRTLVSSGVLGDEVSVNSSGLVFFAVKHGCSDEIETISDEGGTVATITAGSLPAVSPDGTKLAFADEPSLTMHCMPSNPDLTPLYKLVVRTLSSGAQAVYPMVPHGQDTGLPAPISHLSWAADNSYLAVSISAVQDNEGWNVALVDTAAAKYYMSGGGVSFVPVTGSPTKQRSYLREGVYLPGGNLFVSRACCAGVPIVNTSRLMWEVTPAGALVHQVAVGYAALDHVSLDAAADGKWLLYLGGADLYVSQGGATPHEVTGDLIAAAWE